MYLGDGSAGSVLTTEARASRPVVALYNAAGALLGTRSGYTTADGSIVVTWDGKPLETEHVGRSDMHPRAPTATYKATVPDREKE